MKAKDYVIIGAILVIVIGIYFYGKEAGEKKMLRKQIASMEIEHADQIQQMLNVNADLEKRIEVGEQEQARMADEQTKMKIERAKDQDRIMRLEKEAMELPADVLVLEVRDIIECEEVWLANDNNGVLFSTIAFRETTARLKDWTDFTLIREPGYKESIKLYELQVYTMGVEIGDLKLLVKNTTDLFNLQETFNKEMKDLYIKSSGRGFWSIAKDIAVGAAIGAVVFGVLK